MGKWFRRRSWLNNFMATILVLIWLFDIATDSVQIVLQLPCRRLLLVSDRSHQRWHKNSWMNWTAVDSQGKLWTSPSGQLLFSGSAKSWESVQPGKVSPGFSVQFGDEVLCVSVLSVACLARAVYAESWTSVLTPNTEVHGWVSQYISRSVAEPVVTPHSPLSTVQCVTSQFTLVYQSELWRHQSAL